MSNVVTLITGPALALERRYDAMDEDYYLALIQEAAEGHVALGSPSLREHRDDPSLVRYPALLPGLLIRVTGFERAHVLLLLDILAPFLLTLLLYCALQRFFLNPIHAAVITVVLSGSVLPAAFFNVINPKLVILLPLLHLVFFFGTQESAASLMLRGLTIGLMLYGYPHYFLYFAALEACDIVRRILTDPSKEAWLRHIRRTLLIATSVFLSSLPYISAHFSLESSAAASDLWHRVVVSSRLPADPAMQLWLVLGITALLWTRKRCPAEEKQKVDTLLLTLIAGLVVLNQSLLHGIDIMFGLHYRRLLSMFLWITAFFLGSRFLRNVHAQYMILGVLVLLNISILGQLVIDTQRARHALAAELSSSDILSVLERLSEEGGEQVVLAPLNIANLIPVFTHHYTAWNGYAVYQSAEDRELAERYVLQELVEPQQEEERDRSYPSVFSVHAGNRAARARTWCRWKSLFRKSEEECRVPVRSMIRQQDVLRKLDEDLALRSPEQYLELLRQFSVDIVVADIPLPPLIAHSCPREETIGRYTVYRCT